jgi:hypothetical protein
MSESQIPMRSSTAGVPAVDIVLPGDEQSRSTGFAASWPRVTQALQEIFSFPVMLATALVGRVFHAIHGFFVDPDLWWHIKTGETILQTHHWPTTDPYSFTVFGKPWMAAEWLGDVTFAMVARLGGVRALDFFLIGLGAAIMMALYILATLRSGNSKAGFAAAGILSSLAFASFNLRPQMLGYLFLILTLIALERFRKGHVGSLWFLPPLFLVWINTHGSWIVGLGVVFVFWWGGTFKIRWGQLESEPWTDSQRRHIGFVFLLCLLTVPLTPYGTKLAMYPFEVASQLPLSVVSIIEWLPMPFNLSGGKLFLGIVILLFLAQAVLRLRWRLDEFMFFLAGTMMACLHMRFLLLFVPFTAPMVAVIFVRWIPRYDREKNIHMLNAVIMAGVIGAIIYYLPSASYVEQKMKEQFPVEAVEYMQQHAVPGPMFDSYGFGGYLVWTGHKVFIDGRSELYERGGVLSDYLQIADVKPGALAVLRSYGIESVLIENKAPLGTLLSASSEWKRVYTDNLSAIYVRSQPLSRQGTD